MVAVIRRCGGPEISGVKTGGNGDCNEPMMAGKLGLPVPSTYYFVLFSFRVLTTMPDSQT
jgi:hypothetical protein